MCATIYMKHMAKDKLQDHKCMRRTLQSRMPVGNLIPAAEFIHVHFRACSTNIFILDLLKYIMESGTMHT